MLTKYFRTVYEKKCHYEDKCHGIDYYTGIPEIFVCEGAMGGGDNSA